MSDIYYAQRLNSFFLKYCIFNVCFVLFSFFFELIKEKKERNDLIESSKVIFLDVGYMFSNVHLQ